MADTPRKKRPAPLPADEAPGAGRATVADILSGAATGIAGEEAPKKANPIDALAEFKDMLAEQRERQSRLRHVQQFLTSPLFADLSDRPITVSDSREDIDERKRDLDYRIRVLESLVAVMIEERDFLDKIRSDEEATAEAQAEAGAEADAALPPDAQAG